MCGNIGQYTGLEHWYDTLTVNLIDVCYAMEVMFEQLSQRNGDMKCKLICGISPTYFHWHPEKEAEQELLSSLVAPLCSVVLMREDLSCYFTTPRPQWESTDDSDARHAPEEPAASPDTVDRTSVDSTPRFTTLHLLPTAHLHPSSGCGYFNKKDSQRDFILFTFYISSMNLAVLSPKTRCSPFFQMPRLLVSLCMWV